MFIIVYYRLKKATSRKPRDLEISRHKKNIDMYWTYTFRFRKKVQEAKIKFFAMPMPMPMLIPPPRFPNGHFGNNLFS